MIKDFQSGTELNEDLVINGSLTPEAPGEKVMVTLKVPENLIGKRTESWSVYFAMKAKDEVGNASCTFNVAEVTFGRILKPISIAEYEAKIMAAKGTDDDDNNKSKHSKSDDAHTVGEKMKNQENNGNSKEDADNTSSDWWPWWIIIGVSVALTVIIIIALITVIVIKKTKKTYFSVQSEQC